MPANQVKKDASQAQQDTPHKQQGNLEAALARTATRSIALYFSRPVRLFRPSKVSGWHSLKGHAVQHGAAFTPQYLSSLVKNQGLMVIPKHFVPPMLVNAMLGTVLWTTYAEASVIFEPRLGANPTVIAALSGAIAGAVQALVAAPAENVRLVLEGGSGGHSWSHAWKEVFRGTTVPLSVSKQQNIEEIRQVRSWVKEVGEMAGRGWDGWGWGCAKDVCGFATFFAIFDITRRVASSTKIASQYVAQIATPGQDDRDSFWRHFPRTVHGVTLVAGGVIAGLSYEFVGRPWDVARRTVHLDRLASLPDRSAALSVMQKIREDGILVFFRDPTTVPHKHASSCAGSSHRRLYGALRTLARVGPWGVGFLVWEAYGPGLS